MIAKNIYIEDLVNKKGLNNLEEILEQLNKIIDNNNEKI